VGICVSKALQFLREQGISGEVVVADNGSTDGSQEIAARAGARVISVKEKGYGNAIRGGVAASRGKYIIMGDSDDSYDFLNSGLFSRNSERVTTWSWAIVSKASLPQGQCLPPTDTSAIPYSQPSAGSCSGVPAGTSTAVFEASAGKLTRRWISIQRAWSLRAK